MKVFEPATESEFQDYYAMTACIILPTAFNKAIVIFVSYSK
jgi:hypothetical protein